MRWIAEVNLGLTSVLAATADPSYSAADPEGYVPFAPGHPHFVGDTASPSMDVHQAGKRASKISDGKPRERRALGGCAGTRERGRLGR